jgi:hypothetical protein
MSVLLPFLFAHTVPEYLFLFIHPPAPLPIHPPSYHCSSCPIHPSCPCSSPSYSSILSLLLPLLLITCLFSFLPIHPSRHCSSPSYSTILSLLFPSYIHPSCGFPAPAPTLSIHPFCHCSSLPIKPFCPCSFLLTQPSHPCCPLVFTHHVPCSSSPAHRFYHAPPFLSTHPIPAPPYLLTLSVPAPPYQSQKFLTKPLVYPPPPKNTHAIHPKGPRVVLYPLSKYKPCHFSIRPFLPCYTFLSFSYYPRAYPYKSFSAPFSPLHIKNLPF